MIARPIRSPGYCAISGPHASTYQDKIVRNLRCTRIECDEIWSFVYAKDGTIQRAKAAPPDAGSAWTFIAFDPDTKLVPCWATGGRNLETAQKFMKALASRLTQRMQLTTDGFNTYEQVVESNFAGNIDFAMLNKNYGTLEKEGDARRRYTGSTKIFVSGYPEPTRISTSLVERQNLTMRTFMRRFVRKTCCFSKRFNDHRWMIALHFLHYNFARIHRTMRISPAMAAGMSDRLWTIKDIEALAS